MKTTTELRAELAQAEEAERKAEAAQRKAQSEAWNAMTANPDNWEWRAIAQTYRTFGNVQLQGYSIAKRVKTEVLDAWKAKGFGTFSSDYENGRFLGMFYYRTSEGILTNEGGGHCVLNVPMLCNDEEWAAIGRGEIPLKYRR